MKKYKRGEVAKITGVGFEGIRFYEKERLIPLPDRNSSGHRIYSQEIVDCIKFLHHCNKLGFSLKESKELLALNSSCKSVNQKVEIKIKIYRKRFKNSLK